MTHEMPLFPPAFYFAVFAVLGVHLLGAGNVLPAADNPIAGPVRDSGWEWSGRNTAVFLLPPRRLFDSISDWSLFDFAPFEARH